MIRYLRGKVIEKIRNQVVVEVNGVGYDLFVTAATIAQATTGDATEFFISESIREDAHDLFGFRSVGERDMFELLRKVSGVGPKVALSIVGFYSSNELHNIIAAGDSTKLSLVPGIGKKLASKVILELKDKASVASLEAVTGETDSDTVAALESLGYNPAEIAAVLPKVPANLATSQEKITWILRNLGE